MNKGKRILKIKYFLVGLGVTLLVCCFTLSFSSQDIKVGFSNVEALAGDEWIKNPEKYCNIAGGICYLNAENIVYGIQIGDKEK